MANDKALVVAAREGYLPQTAPTMGQLMLDLGALTDPVSLTFDDPGLTYEDWELVGRMTGAIGNAYQWWIGDWLRAGETLFGEQAAQASDTTDTRFDLALRVTGREASTLASIRSVAERVPRERRRGELSFAHHQEVAGLPPEEQIMWLERALQAQPRWTRTQLREAMRAERARVEGQQTTLSSPAAERRTTVYQRVEGAAQELLRLAQPLADGRRAAPEEAWVKLAEAFGEQ